MGAGRRRDNYPVEEFRLAVLANLGTPPRISHNQLADRSGVNRGTISKFVNSSPAVPFPVSRAARVAISSTLNFAAEERIYFCCVAQDGQKPMLIRDYQYPRQAVLSQASALLHQGFYYAAAQEFNRVFSTAEQSGDLLLQADAAGRTALVYLEVDKFNEARRWAYKTIEKCSQCVSMPVSEIIANAPRYALDMSPPKSVLAARILSDVLHNLSQVYLRQMFYYGNQSLEQLARIGLQNCLNLNRRLDLAQPSGNDLRCRAVVEAISQPTDVQLALKLIDQCEDNFTNGGLFEAHRVKTGGLIAVQTGHLSNGRDLLTKADQMLSCFPDARGLASARYLLSDATLRTRTSNNARRQALRYIISAAVLHPYGVVIDRCRQQARHADRRDFQIEIDDLIAGKGLYSAVWRMAGWMAEESQYTAQDLLFRNLDLMLTSNFPQVEIPPHRTAAV
jgi:hypothetical protein